MNYFLVKIFVNGAPYTSSIGGQPVDGNGVHTFSSDGFSFNNLIRQTFGSSDQITLDFQEGSDGASMDNAFNNFPSNYTINNLGNISISSSSVACFSGCKATIGTSNSFEQWDMSGVESLAFCFPEAELSPRDHTWDLSNWDVSQCKDFDIMFMESKTKFTGLNEWDLSSAESFGNTFSGITDLQYQPDIVELDTSNVSSFGGMFAMNTVFNQDISNWDVCKAEDMTFMFADASSFNQDLSTWKTPKILSEPDLFAAGSGMLGEIYYPQWGVSCFPTEVEQSLPVEVIDCATLDPCQGVTCGPDEVCVNGVCQPKPAGADEFHYRYSNFYFTSRQDTSITTRDTSELNDYEQGIGRSTTVDRTLDKKIILPPDFNPNP